MSDSTETPLVPPMWHATMLGAPEPSSEPAPRTAPDDVDRIPLVYIAGPYTAADALAVEMNVRDAERAAYEVARLGAMPVCPHTNLRYMAADIGPFLYPATLKMMRRCDGVLFVGDWARSKGAMGEHEEAKRLGMQRFYNLLDMGPWIARFKGAA